MRPDLYDGIFRQALRIRRVEEVVVERYPSDAIQSPVHLSIGQEHHIAALCAALEPDDGVVTSYRCHALYLAKGGDLRAFFAELYGRATGTCHGKAGSMHLCAPEVGMFGSSAIVGAVLPHALGLAHAYRLRHPGRIAVCVCGDGATEEGVFAECLNFARLRRLPVVYVVEDNGLAIHAHRERRQAYDLAALAAAYGIPYGRVVDGMDFGESHRAGADLFAAARAGDGPQLLEVVTHRYRAHVGVELDYDRGYRDEADYRRWLDRDPLVQDHERRQRYLPDIDAEIADAVRFAEESPVPSAAQLHEDDDRWR